MLPNYDSANYASVDNVPLPTVIPKILHVALRYVEVFLVESHVCRVQFRASCLKDFIIGGKGDVPRHMRARRKLWSRVGACSDTVGKL